LAQGGGPETPSLTPNFVKKINQGGSTLSSKFLPPKIWNFCDFELLRPTFLYLQCWNFA